VINQFTKTIDKNQATTLLKLLRNYQPETRPKKKERLLKEAQEKSTDKKKTSGVKIWSKPCYTLNRTEES